MSLCLGLSLSFRESTSAVVVVVVFAERKKALASDVLPNFNNIKIKKTPKVYVIVMFVVSKV